jgi:glucose-1-phosphate cytidylyltransferase
MGIKAVILCGGRGTRIRDVSELLPKPMLPIGSMPILWHIMKLYSYYGINEFVLGLGYNGWKIKEFFLSYKAINRDVTIEFKDNNSLMFHNEVIEKDWKVTLAETGENAMTGARVWKMRKYVEADDHFALTYGDGVADIDINKLIEFHISCGKIGTVTGVRPASRFGEIILQDSLITSFNEKPNVSEGWINGGFMMFDAKRIWDYLWPDDNLSFEKEPLSALARDHQLAGYKHNGFWQCMDTFREYELLNNLWQNGEAPWKVWKE